MAFGWVIDDESPDKAQAGGAGPFALSLAEKSIAPEAHAARCPSCKLLDEPFACVGLVPTPLPAASEQWLVSRLPDDIESLPGFLLRKAIADFGYEGTFGRELRQKGLLEAPGAFTRHFGPFFRRFTVSSEQLLEELFGAGDVQPAHALALLVHLGAVFVDGKILLALEEGAAFGELMNDPPSRAKRTACRFVDEPGDDEARVELKRYLRALWAAFVVDAPIRIFGA